MSDEGRVDREAVEKAPMSATDKLDRDAEAREPSGGERFVVLDCNAAVVRGWLDGGHWNDYASGLFDTSFDPPRVVAEDGGEPEDQSFTRDWRWVPRELNDLARALAERDAEVERLRGRCCAVCDDSGVLRDAVQPDSGQEPPECPYCPERVNETRAALADARGEVERLVELLESVEWMQPMSNSSPACPRCDGQQHHGHEPYCPLGKRLKQARDARARLAGEKGGEGGK